MAAAVVAFIHVNHRFDSLPFLASSLTLSPNDENVEFEPRYGSAPLDHSHVELVATGERPRLLHFHYENRPWFYTSSIIYTPGMGRIPKDTTFVLHPDSGRRLVFPQARSVSASTGVRIDQPFEASPAVEPGTPLLVVAHVEKETEGWALRLPAWVASAAAERSLALEVGHVAQGGKWCESFLVSVSAASQQRGPKFVTIPCEPRPEVVVFSGRSVFPAGARLFRPEVRMSAVTTMDLGDGVRSAVFSHDERHVLTASDDGTARIWNVDGSGEPIVLQGHTQSVQSAVFSRDDRRVLTASEDETARIWDIDGSGEPIVLQGHTQSVQSAVFSHDDLRVLTASIDGTARIWNVDGSGEPIVLRGHNNWFLSAVFSHDDRRVLTASIDGIARIWNVDGSGEPTVLQGHTADVVSAVFSHDDRRVLTASDDRTARIWNVDGSGEPIVLRGHTDKVHSAVFSHDDRRVLTVSDDHTARIWSVDDGGELRFLPHDAPVVSAVFSHDGNRVLTATEKTVRVWDLETTLPLPDDADDLFVFLRITALE